MDYVDNIIDAPSYTSPPAIVQYAESQARFLPIRITSQNNQYTLLVSEKDSNVLYLIGSNQNNVEESLAPIALDAVSVNDCVIKCQEVIGLKINEIAKLSGVSRATLDLHRKGANVKDMTLYHKLYSFVSKIEERYGNSIKGGIRNVLVDRKTLVQHIMKHPNNLEQTFLFIEEVSEKLQKMNITQSSMDASKSNVRLTGIGRMA